MFDESGRPDEVVKLDKVILDFDPETKEPLISVDLGLVEKLKPHQVIFLISHYLLFDFVFLMFHIRLIANFILGEWC